MNQPLRIEMFGGLRALQDDRIITRFATQKNATLLAFLAFYIHHAHPRETLIELLWPGVEPEIGRNRLRQALAMLRRQLEPPGYEAGSILIADRNRVALNPQFVQTDVSEFECLIRRQPAETTSHDAVGRLTQAVALAHGELLSGYYEDWIMAERERLAGQILDALYRLTAAHEAVGDLSSALQCARDAVRRDPLNGTGQAALIRLCLAANQPAQAVRQYQDFARNLRETLGQTPSPAIRRLIEAALGAGRTDTAPPLTTEPRPAATVAQAAVLVPAGIPASIERAWAFPKPKPAESGAGIHLPMRFTRFFGRAEEIDHLLQRMTPDPPTERIFTLIGPGGCGKTRLAIEVARRLGEQTDRDVWFAPLDDVSDPRLLPGALAAALQLPRTTEIEPLEAVARALDRRPALLVLDNFEQLLAAARDTDFDAEESRLVLRTLLQRAPALICLVTSRQALEMEGEREFPVQPLPTPTKDEGGRMKDEEIPAPSSFILHPSSLLLFPSVQLFVDRAQAARPDFQVTPRTAGAVAALIERLEGIPLAIELTAAWVRTLSITQILDRFSKDFELLTSRRQDLPPRHRTLRATVEWSYRLLPPHLQRLFTRLSVFRSGWTVTAATAVCMDPDEMEENGDCLARLWELQARSLVFTSDAGAERRMQMLDTLREYAAEPLPEAERQQLAQRHARVFLAMAEAEAPRLIGTQQDAACQALDAERDNLRAAMHWALHSETDIALRLAGALWHYWVLRSDFAEGRDMLSRALQCPGPVEARARALMGAGILAQYQGDFAASRACHEEVLNLLIESGGESAIANAHNNLGRLDYDLGDLEGARVHYEASLARWSTLGNRHLIAIAYNNLGLVAREQADFTVASTLFEQSLAYKRELGDRQGIANALHNLGLVAADRGEYQKAIALYEEARTVYRELNNRALEATSLSNLARALAARRDFPSALRFHSESLVLRRDLGDRQGVAFSLEGFAMLAAETGQVEVSARLFGAVEALRENIGAPVPRTDRKALEAARNRTAATLGAEAYETSRTLGRALTLEQAIDYALETTLPH